jgi:glycosyltransferase involved in cell wall biosynthesis
VNIVHFLLGKPKTQTPNGILKAVYYISKNQKKIGHNVEVWSFTPKSSKKENMLDTQVRNRYFVRTPFRFFLDNYILSELKRYRNKIDIAHFHSAYIAEQSSLGKIMQSYDIPYILTPNGSLTIAANKNSPVRTLKKFLYKHLFELKLLNNALAIHAVSPGEIPDIKKYGVKTNIFYVPNGIEISDIPKNLSKDYLEKIEPKLKNCKKLIFCGRLSVMHKGLDLLFKGFAKALEHFHYRKLKLILIGPDFRGGRKALEKLSKQLDITDDVVFLGPIYGAEKHYAIASADVYIQTSRWEGLSLSVLEAMACGKPCILTRETNMPEVFERYNSGLFAKTNPDDICEKIISIFSGDYDLAKMSENARMLIEKEYNWENIAIQICENYKELL